MMTAEESTWLSTSGTLEDEEEDYKCCTSFVLTSISMAAM
jgi:hypothetical protein